MTPQEQSDRENLEILLSRLSPPVQKVARDNADLVLTAMLALERGDWTVTKKLALEIAALSLDLTQWADHRYRPSQVFR